MFIELPAIWRQSYTEEEKLAYSAIYQDESEWPDEEDSKPFFVNVNMIVGINPSSIENQTTLRVMGDDITYKIAMNYELVKKMIYDVL